MNYTVQETVQKCPMLQCQCKSCVFNGVSGLCIGCSECLEHKQLCPVSGCSHVKNGDWAGFSAAALSHSYFISIPTGLCDIPQYYQITKEEFDDFDNWKNDETKILAIQNRNADGC